MNSAIVMMLTFLFFGSIIYACFLFVTSLLKGKIVDIAACAVMLAIANIVLSLLKTFGGTM